MALVIYIKIFNSIVDNEKTIRRNRMEELLKMCSKKEKKKKLLHIRYTVAIYKIYIFSSVESKTKISFCRRVIYSG